MSTLTVYPDPNPESTSVDGIVSQGYGLGVGVTWGTIRTDAGNDPEPNPAQGAAIQMSSDDVSSRWRIIRRSIFLFDTSALGAAATISAAVMSLFGFSKLDQLGISPNIDIYTSNPATNTDLVAGDYAQIGSTSQTGAPISYASYDTTAYNDFTFNGTGLGNISKTGVSKFGARNANYDVSGTTPSWSDTLSSNIQCRFAETASTTSDPKLVITFSTTNIKTFNGVATASVKTVGGVAIASVKTWNGIA